MLGIRIAFYDYNIVTGLDGAEFVGPKYFLQFLSDPNLMNVVRNTLVLNLLRLGVGIPFSLLLALSLTELRSSRLRKLSQTVTYMPHFLSWAVFGGIMLEMISTTGIVNFPLLAVGAIDKPVNFIAKGDTFYGFYTVISVLKSVGFNAILFFAAITRIDRSLVNAAMIDGASSWQRIRDVTLPGIRGMIVVVVIFQLSSILNSDVEQLLVLQNDLNLPFSETIDTYVYKLGVAQMRYSYSAAVGLIKSVLATAILLLTNAAANG